MTRLWAMGSLVMLLSLSVSADGADILKDPLNGSTLGQQTGGSFVNGGWQAGKQIKWDLGMVVTDGGMSIQVTNWNPNTNSPQHQHAKQHIINIYENPHGSPHQSDGDKPKGGFFNIRTGATYDNLFKFLSSTSGFDPPPAGREETRIKKPLGFIDPAKTYTIKVEWKQSGDITAWLDAEQLITHSHGTAFGLRHVFIGTDNAPAGTYGPQKDVIYKNLEVWGTSMPGGNGGAGGTAGTGGAGGGPSMTINSFEPVADTYSDPTSPNAAHGSDIELRTGGDGQGQIGRTIFLRFDVQGAGKVVSAKLYLKAMNAGGGGDIRVVSDNSWTEAGLTHANKPAHDDKVLASLGNVDIDGVYSFDVTAAIPTSGMYSFAITSTVDNGSGYNSREHPATPPELVVEWAPSGTGGSGGGGVGGQSTGGSTAAGGATTTTTGSGASGANTTAAADPDGTMHGECTCRAVGLPSQVGPWGWLIALGVAIRIRRNRRS